MNGLLVYLEAGKKGHRVENTIVKKSLIPKTKQSETIKSEDSQVNQSFIDGGVKMIHIFYRPSRQK